MARLSDNNADFEMLIAEAREADRAGVFARTRVDLEALAEAPRSSLLIRFYERAMVGLPLAACVAIVVGIASWGIRSGPVDHRSALVFENAGELETVVEACGPDVFARCVSGPGQPIGPGCGCADLDSDGDVDLWDLSSYQRLAGTRQ